jgi:hypothetical protein
VIAELIRHTPDIQDRKNPLAAYYWQLVELGRYLLYSEECDNEKLTEIQGYLKYTRQYFDILKAS